MKTRRVMEDFEIDEISAVDRPAQKHARMTIIKNESGKTMFDDGVIDVILTDLSKRYIDPAEGAKPLQDFLQENVKERQFWDQVEKYSPTINALDSSLRSIVGDSTISDESKMGMMRKSIEEFMLAVQNISSEQSETLQKAFVAKGENEMKTAEQLQKEVDDLSKKLDEATKKLNASASAEVSKLADLEKSVKELEEKLKKAETDRTEALAKAQEADLLAKMSEDEKTAMADMEAEEAKKFLNSTPAERRKTMKKREENDEVLKVGDAQIRKSAVGDAAFSVFKAQQERIEKAEETARIEKAAREHAEFTKRAADELTHFTGEVDVKAKVLKAVSEISDESTRTALSTMLKSGNGALKAAFDSIGHKDGKGNPVNKADAEKFTKRVSEIASRDKITQSAAMTKARAEYPEEFKAYQAANSNS